MKRNLIEASALGLSSVRHPFGRLGSPGHKAQVTWHQILPAGPNNRVTLALLISANHDPSVLLAL